MCFSALTSSRGGGNDDGDDDDVFLFSVCDWAVVRSGWVHLHCMMLRVLRAWLA